MAQIQTQRRERAFSHTQGSDDAVAVDITALHNTSKSSDIFQGFEQQQPKNVTDVDEELPPYECVLGDAFIVDADQIQNCNRFDWIGPCQDERQRLSSDECPMFPVDGDFILFPSHGDESSTQDSSIVSFFEDDLSFTTQCDETTSSCNSSGYSPLHANTTKSLLPKRSFYRDANGETRIATRRIVDWLSRVDLGDGDLPAGDTGIREGQQLTNIDETKHAENFVRNIAD